MTAKERVKKTFAHEEPDRVPFFELTVANPVLSEVLGRKIVGAITGESKAAALRANMEGKEVRRALIKENVEGMVEMFAKVGFDMIWIRPTEYLTPVGMALNDFIAPNYIFDVVIEEIDKDTFRISNKELGFWSIEKYSPIANSCPTINDSIKEGGIKELKRYIDILDKAKVSIDDNEYIKDGLEGLRIAIESEVSKRGDLFICGNADVAFPTYLPYIGMFLELMMDMPALVEKYMEVTTWGTLELLRAQLEMGVDGIIGGTDICYNKGPLISPSSFKKFVAPYLKIIVDECHKYGVPYIKHLDGNVEPILDILINDVGIDGLHSIEPAAGMDIGKIKRKYGKKITLLGNIDCAKTLTVGSREDIIREVRQIIKTASPGGGHVFASSNCIHSGVTIDAFWTMVESVKEYGKYPIQL